MKTTKINIIDKYDMSETITVSNISFTKERKRITSDTLDYINTVIDNDIDDIFNINYPNINYQFIDNERYYMTSIVKSEIANICYDKIYDTNISINVKTSNVPKEFENTLHDYLVNTIPYIICEKILEWENYIIPILLGKVKNIKTIHTLSEYDMMKNKNYWLNKFRKEYSESIFNYILNNYNNLKTNILEKTDKKILKIIENIL